MSDPLLEAILADPDDDDARLVWADREGGERGELVVVQCRLARLRRVDEASRAEMHRLFAREKELLAKLAPSYGPTVRWRRGFIHHHPVWSQRLETRAGQDALFAELPLLESIEIIQAPRPELDEEQSIRRMFELLPPGRIHTIVAHPTGPSPRRRHHVVSLSASLLRILADTAAGREVRALLPGASYGDITGLEGEVLQLQNLERIESSFARIRPLARPGVDWPTLLRGLPRLSSLGGFDIDHGRRALRALAETPATRQVRSLSLVGCDVRDTGARRIATSTRFANLERLVIDRGALSGEGIRAIAESPRLTKLTALDVSRNQLSDDAIAQLARASFAPNLRVLRARHARFTPAVIPHLLAFPALERLDIRTDHDSTDRLRAIDDVIPHVSR